MTGYYDLVLGLIPLTLAGVTGVLVAAGFSLTIALPIAGLVAMALIGHAMFVRAPVSTSAPPTVDGSGLNAGDGPGFNSAD